MRSPILAFALAAGLVAGACDPNAKAAAPAVAPSDTEQASRQYETCSSSLECKTGLRCVDGACRSEQASVLGDYYAAVGERELGRDNVKAAIESFTRAVNQYKVEEVPAPATLFCAQGHALARDRNNQENAELAARVLHRCVRDLPARSRARRQALADLALLGDVGLDPMLLGAKEDADRYLTKAPKAPPTDAVKVSADGDVRTSSNSYSNFLQKLQSDEVREQLIPCWQTYWKASNQKTVKVTLPVKYYFHQGYYEDQDRYKLVIEEDAPAPTSPEATAKACIHGVVAPVADEYSRREGGSGRWSGKITLTLGPG